MAATISKEKVRRALRALTTVTETAPGQFQVDYELTGGYSLAELRNYMFEDTDWDALAATEKGEVLRAVLRIVFVLLTEPD